MRKVFNILIWLIIISGIIFALYFMGIRQSKIKCDEFSIIIDYNNSEPLISKEEIKIQINKIIDTIEGKQISNIPILEIETVLNKNPIIQKADIYSTLDGKLKVKILQKHPIIRISNSKNQNIYIDINGSVMPAGKGSPARVIIANGYIHAPVATVKDTNLNNYKILKDLFKIAKFIHKNELLNAQIEQIYVTESDEFELIPKLGNHIIKFGNLNKMERKFKKLIAFYKNGINNDELTKYKVLDLKYANQVICSK